MSSNNMLIWSLKHLNKTFRRERKAAMGKPNYKEISEDSSVAADLDGMSRVQQRAYLAFALLLLLPAPELPDGYHSEHHQLDSLKWLHDHSHIDSSQFPTRQLMSLGSE